MDTTDILSSSGQPQTAVKCWHCARTLDPGDNYCRHCGKGQGLHAPWCYKHWGIIFLTFFAVGPFSLFFVWRSPVLSPLAKKIYTAAILIFTWLIIRGIYNFWLVLRPFFSLGSQLQQLQF
ncbi:MAG: zinc ribbon domain-containing protein [bacterium]